MGKKLLLLLSVDRYFIYHSKLFFALFRFNVDDEEREKWRKSPHFPPSNLNPEMRIPPSKDGSRRRKSALFYVDTPNQIKFDK